MTVLAQNGETGEGGEIQVKGIHYPVKIYMVAEELPEDAASAE